MSFETALDTIDLSQNLENLPVAVRDRIANKKFDDIVINNINTIQFNNANCSAEVTVADDHRIIIKVAVNRKLVLDIDVLTMNNQTIHASRRNICGNNNTVYGDCNVLSGNNNKVYGHKTVSSGNNCIIHGHQTVSSGNHCELIGSKTTSSGNHCKIVGNNCTSSGNKCVVRGMRNTVQGNNVEIIEDPNVSDINTAAAGTRRQREEENFQPNSDDTSDDSSSDFSDDSSDEDDDDYDDDYDESGDEEYDDDQEQEQAGKQFHVKKEEVIDVDDSTSSSEDE